MELISKLIENYKEQVKLYYEIERITSKIQNNDESIEGVIKKLHESQKLIDKINVIEESRIDIENKCVNLYKMEKFEIEYLPDEINTGLQIELAEIKEMLQSVIKSVLECKVHEKSSIEEYFVFKY